MSLWDWTLDAYSRPGVAEACLVLQDEHGLNTAYLLWAVWAEGAPDPVLDQAAGLAKAWDNEVLKPVRAVRKRLKPAFPGIDDAEREGLRDDIKAAELRAERVLMENLAHLAKNASGGMPAQHALIAAARAWGMAPPEQALAVLAGALR